ncbi:MAG: ATP-grasp domain-containing protein [Terriglobales bacterium]
MNQPDIIPSEPGPVRPRVLLITATTGYQTEAVRQAAERLGVTLLLATDRCHVLEDPWGDRALAVRFEAAPEAMEEAVDRIVALAATAPFQGVVALGDRASVIAAGAAARLGLPGHPPEAAARARDKFLTHQVWAAALLPVARFERFPAVSDPDHLAARVTFPCVLKPLTLSGSRGVIRANDREEFRRAFRRIRALLQEPALRQRQDPAGALIQVEEYLPGREFALEGLLTAGLLQPLALFDKPDPLEGPFFEETLYITPARLTAAEQAAIVSTVQRAAAALGLWHGPVHAEVRVNPRGVFVLEVAPRPIGGLCAQALRFVRGAQPGAEASLEELLLRHALGESAGEWRREAEAAGVLMLPIPQRGVLAEVAGVAEAAAEPGITAVTITAKPDQLLVPLPEGATYLGFVFARAATPAAVETALRRAHARLHVVMRAVLPVVSEA